jgi:hypothetical protein
MSSGDTNAANDRKKQKKRKAYSITTTVIIFVLSGILIWMYTSTQQSQNSFADINERLEAINEENEIYAEILTADNLVFEGDYDRALEIYQEIYPQISSNNKVVITNRIERIKAIIASAGNNEEEEAYKDYVIKKYKDSIQKLGSKLDSLQWRVVSGSEDTNERIASLTKQLEEKTRQLNQKNNSNVQVISFNANGANSKVYYLGEVRSNKANGGGIGIWTATGSVYRGEWENNQRHGNGTFEWNDGMRYEGEFVNDKREGQGTYFWPSGERYEGEWRNSKRNGYGTLYDPDGNIQFEGNWVDDKPVRG